MMSDPERLLAGHDAADDAELERELLRAIVDVSPPPHAEQEAWNGIAAQIAAASALAAGVAALSRADALPGAASALKGAALPVGAGLSHAFATKVVVGAVVAVTATGASAGLWYRYGTTSRGNASSGVVESAGGRSMTTGEKTPTPIDRPAPSAAPAALAPGDVAVTESPEGGEAANGEHPRNVGKATRVRPDDTLALESAALTEARASLRGGDPRGALATLGRLDVRVPRGVLSQEREVLAIQALAASGDHATASRRAAAFVRAHPGSPHTPSLRALAEGP